MSLFQYVGEQIRVLRTNYGGGKGVSQEMLGREISVAANTVSRWETATYQPTLEDLEKLARFFGISILAFFPGKSDEETKVAALLRAAKDLPAEDLEELKRYAEFRRARHVMGQMKAPVRGRKRQEKCEQISVLRGA